MVPTEDILRILIALVFAYAVDKQHQTLCGISFMAFIYLEHLISNRD